MTKSQFIDHIARRFPALAPVDARLSVDLLLEHIAAALTAGRRVEIRGFGVFDVSVRQAHMARNPRTGEIVAVPEKAVPRFRAGLEMRRRVAGTRTPG